MGFWGSERGIDQVTVSGNKGYCGDTIQHCLLILLMLGYLSGIALGKDRHHSKSGMRVLKVAMVEGALEFV